jgi:predicted unusual protein kinase regulating ubiquinone biosynthesis (AarF/ABC1/UbiB family)
MFRSLTVAKKIILFALKNIPILIKINRSKCSEQNLVIIGDRLFDLFSELSGTFVKFGQILSMRPDLLPLPICHRLSDLLDSVPAEEFDESLKTLSEELNSSNPLNRFYKFKRPHIAAASFATVYVATIEKERKVAVKIQRRGLQLIVRGDIQLLRFSSSLLDLLGVLRRFKAREFVEDFAAWTLDELNYYSEARSQTRIRLEVSDSSIQTFVPEVIWNLSTSRVLVSDFASGVWVSTILKDKKYSRAIRENLASQIFFAMMEQVFEHGFFHADPHAGNICLRDDGTIAMIDFGIVGHLSPDFKRNQLCLLQSLQSEDTDKAFLALQSVLIVPPDADLQSFKMNIEKNIREWAMMQYQPGLPSSNRSAGGLLLKNFQAAREAGVYFSSDAARYYRAFIVLDSVIVSLDNDFDHRLKLREYFQERDKRIVSRQLVSITSRASTDIEHALARLVELFPTLFKRLEYNIQTPPSFKGAFKETKIRASRFLKLVSGLGKYLLIVSIVLLCAKTLPTNSFTIQIEELLSKCQYFSLQNSAITTFAVWILCGWWSRMLWINAYSRNV